MRIVDHYTYLGVVLHKSGCFKAAIEKLAAAGKRALFAMQYRCSELGLNDTHLRCSLFSSLVQPVLSYSCEVWCLERSSLLSQMNTVHNHFMKRTLHVRKSVPDGVVLCELGRVPLQLYWQKMLLKYVSRISELPSDRLVKKAFTHASSVNTLWWQKLSLWLSQHRFEGVLAEGTFSLVNAEQHLRDKWYHGICQSSATKVSFFMDNMFFDSNVMASYLRDIRPSAPLFSLIKFRLGAHSLRVETDRWLRPKPPREQRVCRHCSMQAVEDEQHFLFDCPFYSIIRGQHFSLFGPNYQQRDIRLFFEQNSHQLGFVAHHIHLCFQARMSDESLLAPHPRL